MGQPQRRQAGGGLVVEDALEQRRRFLSDGGLPAVVGVTAGAAARAIGIAALVERIEGADPLAGSAVDQIDARQVPARDAQMQLAQVPLAPRHGAVRSPCASR